jgi:alpha-glucosidase
VDPGISATKGYAVFEEGVARDAFCRTESGSLYNGSVWPGKTVFPDFVRTEVRTWWAEQIAGHLNKGLSGIWNDMNEPSSNIPLTGMRFDRGAVLHERHHNEYALLMGLATLEGAYAAQPGQRPFILSRAGSAGIQRVAANWSGDNCARWEHLWMSIPMLTGIGLSGQPFTGADIPGFFENPDPELMVRWYQAGAFYPFCRNHSCNWGRERYPWSFGPAVEKVVREALRRRYQLLPYIYTAFVQASETGAPVMRPLVFDFQYDDAARETDDQFMLGESLMIAPVCQPGRTSRQVYLPEGWWYDWRDSALLEGGRFITAAAPMDSIPVYARAGCMIPLWPEPPQTTMNYQPEAIELRVFVPPANGVFTARLIEDDGITLEYQQGKQFDTQFKMVREKNRLILRGTTRGESFDGFKRRHFRIVPVGAPLDPVTCAAAPSFEHSWNL